MQYLVRISLLLVVLAVGTESVDLPSGFKTCKFGIPNYSECVSKAIEKAVVALGPGLRTFDILPIEPLRVNIVKIGGTTGSISLEQTYTNIKLHGLTKGFETSDFDFDFENLIMRTASYNPQVEFVGDYDIAGSILFLPIKGHGHSNITLLGLKAKNTVYFKKFNKDGEDFLRVEKFDVKFAPKKVLLRFDNLFGGDITLGERMNIFLNENSDLLFKELQGAYEELFGQVFAQIANNIFTRVSIDKIFRK